MAISTSSSSLSLSKIFFFPSPSTITSKNHLQSPLKNRTQLGFPLLSPSISLRTQKNPRNGGLAITSMGTYNVQVVVDENEPEERLLSRFRREVIRAGVVQECKRRRFFENTHDKKKRKSREAAKRNRRRRPLSKTSKQDNNTEKAKKKDLYDFEDDNWDLPEGDLPY